MVAADQSLTPLRVLRRVSSALDLPGELDQRLTAAAATLMPELADDAEVRWSGRTDPLVPSRPTPTREELAGAHVLELPLDIRGSHIGAVRLRRTAQRPAWSEAERLAAEEVAARMAAAIDADQRVAAAGGMNDELLATLSHELRTPLNVVIGWIDLLRRGRLEPDRQLRAYELIERNARAQSRLVEDLLDASRAVRGRLRLLLAPVAVGEIVLAAVDALRPQAEAQDVTVVANLPSAVTIHGDGERLGQVIQNLVSNAVKFTSAGGQVTVTAARIPDREWISIEVADTGVGIDPELLPRIFDRFWQGERRRSGRIRGLGLGLFIARHLVELHGGSMTAASDGPGRGARFTLELPLAGPP